MLSFASSRRVRARLGLLALLVSAAGVSCSDDSDDDETTPAPTTVGVNPIDFLKKQVCQPTDGAVRSYQATLLDVTDGWDDAFVLPSSDVIGCTQAAFFTRVTPGRRYVSRVAAFDQADLRVQKAGVPIVVDAAGKPVTPRWTTTCWGDDGAPLGIGGQSGVGGAGGASSPYFGGAGGAEAQNLGVEAFLNATVYTKACDALSDAGEPGATGVSIRITASLQGLSCGEGDGQVSRFVVIDPNAPPPENTGGATAGGAGGSLGEGGSDPGPSETIGATCNGEARVVDLEPGRFYSYRVEAYSSDEAEPRWATNCRAYTVSGVVVAASCGALEEID